MKKLKLNIATFENIELPNYDIINGVISSLSNALNVKLETYFIEGLKRKGFEFENQLELEQFIKHRCRCEDYLHLKQKTYFIDNEPFFLHDYNVEMNLNPITEDRKTTISANYGSFTYL